MKSVLYYLSFAFVFFHAVYATSDEFPWTWSCQNEKCVKLAKTDLTDPKDGNPVNICKLNCDPYGSLWPRPTGKTQLGKQLVPFDPQNVIFNPSVGADGLSHKLQEAFEIFKINLIHPTRGNNVFPESVQLRSPNSTFIINTAIAEPDPKLVLHTDESYLLNVAYYETKDTIEANIKAHTYYGARHGLETLSQLIGFDSESKQMKIVGSVTIEDAPVYTYRGILIDTARNFISPQGLKKLIDGMSYNKLNMLHWHIMDSQSFPMFSKSVPKMSQYGAYSPEQVYSTETMQELVKYADVRGVKIVAEFDAPAHAGNGWQWGKSEGLGDMAVCVNQEPWSKYCVEPPCGQLNPVNENMYKTLGNIYKDMLDIFDNDLFHMGGDEVNLQCWNDTEEITKYLEETGRDLSEESFMELWAEFQNRALSLVTDHSKSKNMKAILWTSHLVSVENVEKFIDKDKYIVQIWSKSDDEIVPYLIDSGYNVILSNYDAWYLDCGYGAWVGWGPTNWCSPYKGWQQIYENDPFEIYRKGSRSPHSNEAVISRKILGGESALWTEQTDESSMESKIWPRASALAERLWSNPGRSWRDAESRMVHNRQRYVERGLNPDRLQPQWCHQNEGLCYA